MSDRTARLVHWLADGRSAALVAPAIRAATSPGARGALERARAAGDLLDDIDLERARRIVERLSDDREFRRSLSVAGERVQHAVEESERRGGRRALIVVVLVLAVVAGVVAFMRRPAGPHASDGSAGAPSESPATYAGAPQ